MLLSLLYFLKIFKVSKNVALKLFYNKHSIRCYILFCKFQALAFAYQNNISLYRNVLM